MDTSVTNVKRERDLNGEQGNEQSDAELQEFLFTTVFIRNDQLIKSNMLIDRKIGSQTLLMFGYAFRRFSNFDYDMFI
ncbi:hypothetical protein ES702_01063 [subsurface metagenome]